MSSSRSLLELVELERVNVYLMILEPPNDGLQIVGYMLIVEVGHPPLKTSDATES